MKTLSSQLQIDLIWLLLEPRWRVYRSVHDPLRTLVIWDLDYNDTGVAFGIRSPTATKEQFHEEFWRVVEALQHAD